MERKGRQEQILPYNGLVVGEGGIANYNSVGLFDLPKGFMLDEDVDGTMRLRTLDTEGKKPVRASRRANYLMDIL